MTATAFLSTGQTRLTAVRIALLAALSVLVVASLLPSDYMPATTWEDKLEHFGAYLVVGGLAMLGIRSPERRKHCFYLLIVLGLALEVGQIFVPGRKFDLLDMAANGAGAGLAYLGSRLWLN